MTFFSFSLANGFRNKARTFLMIMGATVSIFLLTLLQVFMRELTQPPELEESSYRVITIPKTSLADILPLHYRARIEKIEGVQAVSPLIWFGGIYIDERNFFPQFAVDPNTIFTVVNEMNVDPAYIEAFKNDKRACIVGIETMERFNWKIGQKITLKGTIWGFDAELIIKGIYSGGIDKKNLWFRHDYFDDMMGKPGFTGSFWIKGKTPEDVPKIAQKIDDTFKNTEAETKTETERAFVLGFISMLGDVKTIILSLSSVIMFTLLVVTAGTMAMNIRERYREIAMLKAIGFNKYHIIRLIFTEIISVIMIGGIFGCLIVFYICNYLDLPRLTHGVIVSFELTTAMVGRSLLIAFLTGLISSIAPTLSVLKIPVVEGLRDIE